MNLSLRGKISWRPVIQTLVLPVILGLSPISNHECRADVVDEELRLIKELKKRYGEAIVHLSTQIVDHMDQASPPITGTGFIISESGYVITANHVIPLQTPEGYKTVEKTKVHIGSRTGKSLQATVKDRIPEHDLALLKIENPPPNLKKVTIGDSRLVVDPEADYLYWAGYPGPEDLFIRRGRFQSLSSVSVKSKWVAQIDGTQGDSGGPIFFKGDVVAVAQEGYETTQMLKYLAPIIYADKFFESLKLWPPWKGRQITIEKFEARNKIVTNSLSDTREKSEVKVSELFAIRERQNNRDESVHAHRYMLFEVAASLFLLKKHFSSNELTNGLDALDRGDASPAIRLLEKVAVTHESNAGEASYRLGSIAEINVEYQKALNWYKVAISKPKPEALYFDAAAAMAHKIGDQSNALKWAKESVRLRKSKLKDDEPGYAIAICAVGQLLVESEPKAAIHNCEEAVTILKNHRGQELGIADAYDIIGASYEFDGNPPKAEHAYRKALNISERVAALPGGFEAKKIFGNSSNNLAGLYRSMGRHRDSLSLTAKAISINETIYGKDHPRLGIDLVGLGNIHLALGDYAAAKESFDRAYGLLSSALGRKNRLVAATLMYMAPLAFIQKNDKEAIAIATDALEVFQELYGKANSVYEMQVRMILAELKSLEGNYEEAQEELTRSENIIKSKYKTRVDDIFRIYLLRAATHLRQLQLKEANTSLEKAQKITGQIVDRDKNQDNPILGEYYLLKGKLHSKNNKPLDAEKALDKAQDIFKASLGPTHPKRREALAELANVQRNAHKDDASLQTLALLNQILAARPEVRTVTAIDLTL